MQLRSKILTLSMLFAFSLPLAMYALETYTLAPGAASIAASSTNTTAGTLQILPQKGMRNVRIYVSANGIAATTNANPTNQVLVIHFVPSFDGTNFDTSTNIKLTLPMNGTNTMRASDWYNLEGAFSIKQLQTENLTLGVASNLTIKLMRSE